MDKQTNSHIKWIDAAKAIAILAVVIDHSVNILYSERSIALSTFFSVTVFVFLAGITSYYSSQRHKEETIGKEILRKAGSIFSAYAIATLIYQIVMYRRFDLMTYLEYLVGFDISSPFYFVAFFLQLAILSPYLYRSLTAITYNKWKNKLVHSIFIISVIGLSMISIRYTYILDLWGGGKYLFGGSYLLVYYIGEVVAHYGVLRKTKRSEFGILVSFLMVCFCVLWLRKYEFSLDNWIGQPFGAGMNPPGITLMIYSMCIVLFLYYVFSYLEIKQSTLCNKIYALIVKIGQYSLYIFLYHKLVLSHLQRYIDISNIWIKRVVYISAMIGIPIVVKMMFDKIKYMFIKGNTRGD